MKAARHHAIYILVIFACLRFPALADTGPCRLNAEREIQICGCGSGAAIVIRDTASPSKKIALAWRTPEGPPTEEPDDEKIELLVIRPEDGKILAKGNTAYWDTGEMHANRRSENAFWSPDSKWLVAEFSTRFSSDVLELFALDGSETAQGPLDIMKVIDPAVRAKQRARSKNADDLSFSVTAKENDKPLTVDNAGNVRAEIMLWAPKYGPMYYYTVRAKITRQHDKLGFKVNAVDYRGMEKEQR